MLQISFKLLQWINGSVNDTEMKAEMGGAQVQMKTFKFSWINSKVNW